MPSRAFTQIGIMYLIPPPKRHGVDRRSNGHLRPEICASAAGGWARRLPFVVSGGLIRRYQAQSVRNCSVRGAFSEAGSGIWGARLSYLAFRPSPSERSLAVSVRPCFSALAHSGMRYARCFGASSRDNEARKVRPAGPAKRLPPAGAASASVHLLETARQFTTPAVTISSPYVRRRANALAEVCPLVTTALSTAKIAAGPCCPTGPFPPP